MLKDFTQENFDIVIQAGQSNSEGTGFGDASAPFEPHPDIWYLNADMTISQAQERVWLNGIVGNFSLSFARRYVQEGRLAAGRKLLIIRAAVGGTGFADHRWGLQDDLFLHMMEMIRTALALNPANRLIALLWHQGETDAYNSVTQAVHEANLSALVNAVRAEFACPALPFLAGDFVPLWKQHNPTIIGETIQAMRQVCAQIGAARFVESDGLASNQENIGNEDDIHFCREALYTLGERYYEAFCTIVK